MKMCKKIKSIEKQIKTNFKYIVKKASNWTSYIIAVSQLICFLCDFNDIFPDDWIFIKRALISFIVILIIWILAFILILRKILKNECVEVINDKSNHHLYLEYGNLFEDTDKKRNIVITANRCFDTIVDDDLITSNTVHGQAINKICSNGYSVEMLNEALQKDLSKHRKVKPEIVLTPEQKRKGNLERYPIGTIAEFKDKTHNNLTYFFVGMSAFNKDLHPETTDKEYITTIQSLIEYCNVRSQKIPVYIPIIGTHGLTNKKTERELLEYMVSAFRFNKHLINTDIHIVVYSERRDEVSIYGL